MSQPGPGANRFSPKPRLSKDKSVRWILRAVFFSAVLFLINACFMVFAVAAFSWFAVDVIALFIVLLVSTTIGESLDKELAYLVLKSLNWMARTRLIEVEEANIDL